MTEKFKEWLNGVDIAPFTIENDSGASIYVKVQKDNNFVYIYHQQNYGGNTIERGRKVEYEGLYSKSHDRIYDTGYALSKEFPELINEENSMRMMETMQLAVREKVEKKVGNDKSNFNDIKLSQESLKRLAQYKKRDMENDVRRTFLQGTESNDVAFRCDYTYGYWSENDLLSYITDSQRFIDVQAQDYFDKYKEYILCDLHELDMLKKELQNLENQEDGVLHRIKNIMKAASDSNAKKLMVTVNKDGESFTFKTSAEELRRDPSSYYSTWYMDVKDRRAFEVKFGRNAHYIPEEITDITYCGKSIYSAEPYVVEQTTEEGMGMKM